MVVETSELQYQGSPVVALIQPSFYLMGEIYLDGNLPAISDVDNLLIISNGWFC